MTPPQHTADPVTQAHRSRHGRASGRPPSERRTSLRDRDAAALLQAGFFPTAEAAEGKEMEGLADLVNEAARHVEQLAEARAAITALTHKYAEEDAIHEASIRQAYAEGTELPKDKRTPQEKRIKVVADAQGESRAAADAAYEWATEALAAARENAMNWQGAISLAQARTRDRIEALNLELDALKADLRRDTHVDTWVKRLTRSVTTPGTLVPFSMLAAHGIPDELATVSGPIAEIIRRESSAARGL